MDNTKLAEIKSRAEAATPGPWRHWPEAGDIEITTDGFKEPIVSKVRPRLGWGENIYVDNQEPDAEFIAHAREDIPALVAALEAAEAELTRQDTIIANVKPREIATDALTGFALGSDIDRDDVWQLIVGVVESLAAAPVSLEAAKAETTEETRVWYSFGVNSGKAVGFSAEHIVERLERETMGPVQVDKVERRTVTASEWLPVETEGDNRG